MALKKTTTTVHEFEAVDAYHKVGNLSLVGKTEINFTVYASKTPNSPPFWADSFTCAYDLNGNNPLAQAYVHLKTLPEFADAVSC